MKTVRILHINDDPILRSIVELSLGLDDLFILDSCTSKEDVAAIVPRYTPDLILCDVTTRTTKNQVTLLNLSRIAAAASIPIVAMTTQIAQSKTDRLKSIGIDGVIVKPLDPFTLPEILRSHLRSFRFKTVGYDFDKRLLADAATLTAFGKMLSEEPDSDILSERLQTCAHKLAGAAGVFNFPVVSSKASALEESVIESRAGRGSGETIKVNLDALLECIGRE